MNSANRSRMLHEAASTAAFEGFDLYTAAKRVSQFCR